MGLRQPGAWRDAYVKDKVCTYCWESLEELEAAITEVLKEWWQREKGFSSMFRHSYFRSELNVF